MDRTQADPMNKALARAFTLVEMLVVIGIISVMVGALLPVLSKARESAKTIACLSNLRTFGLAEQAYASNHRGWFVPIISHDPNLGANTTDDNWYGNQELRRYLNIPAAVNGANRYNWPKGLMCPNAVTAVGPSFGASYWITYSYGAVYIYPAAPFTTANSYGFIRSIGPGRVTSPAEKIQMCDALGAAQEIGSSNYRNASYGWDLYGESGSPNHIAYRHQDGLNILHFDGHADWVRKADIAYPLATSDSVDKPSRNINRLWKPEMHWVNWP